MIAPDRISVHANGMRFGALAWGDARAPLALLLHGYPDTAWTWRHLGPELASHGWRAVAPFTRGYAPTALAPDARYFLADLVDDALALHAALGGDERAALVGHDWGAITAWALMAREPERFARHVCLSVPPPVAMLHLFRSRPGVRVGVRQTAMSWYLAYNQIPGTERTLARVIPALWRRWSPGYDAREDLEHVFAAIAGPGRARAVLDYYRHNLRSGAKALFTTGPSVPALYLHGERDGCLHAGLADLIADRFPAGSRREVLPGLGHFPQLEDPAGVGARIVDWLGAPGT